MIKLTTNNFYTSKIWKDFRRTYILNHIKRCGGVCLCEHCHNPIYIKGDIILHHKQELTDSNVNDYDISLNSNNILVCHLNCHNEIHDKWGQGKREVYIVYGAPCSGKTSFVSSLLHRDDMVIDTDYIYKMINLKNDLYDKPDRLSKVVFRVRETLFDCVYSNTGFWQRAYIIIGKYTTEAQLDRMCEKYNARLVHIDTTKEECIKNLFNDKTKEYVRKDWLEYIEEFFDDMDIGAPLS